MPTHSGYLLWTPRLESRSYSRCEAKESPPDQSGGLLKRLEGLVRKQLLAVSIASQARSSQLNPVPPAQLHGRMTQRPAPCE